MSYELSRRLRVLAVALVAIGQSDNARALERRLANGSAIAWLHTPHGEHVWAEIAGGLEVAKAIRPTRLAKLVTTADHAFGEADVLLVDALPRPARIPTADLLSITERLERQARELERPTLRLVVGGRDSNPPKRAA